MTGRITHHRFVRFAEVDAFLRVGWIALPSLAGTHHGEYSVHVAWLCDCFPVTPLVNRHVREPADGKWRPVEPGTLPLAHGVPGRVGRLRAYGNAIVPQVAAEFVAAFMEAA